MSRPRKLYKVYYKTGAVGASARITVPIQLLEELGMPEYVTVEKADGYLIVRPVKVVEDAAADEEERR